MPRKFDYKTDFSQLKQQKSQEELIKEMTDRQIQALIDEAFDPYPVDLEKVDVHDTYITFSCYPLSKKMMGVFQYFDRGYREAIISGTINVEASIHPVYRARLEMRWDGYGFDYADKNGRKIFELDYGSKQWKEKTTR